MNECRSRCLAARASNTDYRNIFLPALLRSSGKRVFEEQFIIHSNWNVVFSCMCNIGRIEWHTLGFDDKITIFKIRKFMLAEHEPNIFILFEYSNRRCELLRCFEVGHGHLCPTLGQKDRIPEPFAEESEPKHCHLFTFEIRLVAHPLQNRSRS